MEGLFPMAVWNDALTWSDAAVWNDDVLPNTPASLWTRVDPNPETWTPVV